MEIKAGRFYKNNGGKKVYTGWYDEVTDSWHGRVYEDTYQRPTWWPASQIHLYLIAEWGDLARRVIYVNEYDDGQCGGFPTAAAAENDVYAASASRIGVKYIEALADESRPAKPVTSG